MAVVIAHRTCCRHAPENSIEGITRAAELGADGAEMDVRVTKDRVPVLLHDLLLLRTTGVPVPLPWLPLRTVRRVAGRGGGVPLAADAVAAARTRGLRPVLDVKDARAAPAVVAALEAAAGPAVSLWSQYEEAVTLFAGAGHVTDDVALLRDTFSPADHEQLLRDASRLGAGAVSAHWDAVDAAFIRRAADAGLRVYSWCQWADRHAEKVGLGLAGVVTDWPDLARRAGF
ncbi:MAG: glycerophosphodiester phosphodiesterase [Acidimicrobiales bacterium]